MSDQPASFTTSRPDIMDVAPLLVAAMSLWSSDLISGRENSGLLYFISLVALFASQCLALTILGTSIQEALRPSFWGSTMVLLGLIAIASPMSADRLAWMVLLITFILIRFIRRQCHLLLCASASTTVLCSYWAIIGVLLVAIWAGSPSA